jgi:hypothetical protein
LLSVRGSFGIASTGSAMMFRGLSFVPSAVRGGASTPSRSSIAWCYGVIMSVEQAAAQTELESFNRRSRFLGGV